MFYTPRHGRLEVKAIQMAFRWPRGHPCTTPRAQPGCPGAPSVSPVRPRAPSGLDPVPRPTPCPVGPRPHALHGGRTPALLPLGPAPRPRLPLSSAVRLTLLESFDIRVISSLQYSLPLTSWVKMLEPEELGFVTPPTSQNSTLRFYLFLI